MKFNDFVEEWNKIIKSDHTVSIYLSNSKNFYLNADKYYYNYRNKNIELARNDSFIGRIPLNQIKRLR